jgi:hypothetical protein
MKTSIQINPFFNPGHTRLNNDFVPNLIISSIVIKQDFNPDQSWFQSGSIITTYPDLSWIQSRLIKTSIRIHHHFKPEFNHDYLPRFIKTSIRINHEFNPDQSWLQSASITTLNQNSIMTFYPDLSWLQSGTIILQSRFMKTSIQINPFFNPDQTRLNNDFIPDLIIS